MSSPLISIEPSPPNVPLYSPDRPSKSEWRTISLPAIEWTYPVRRGYALECSGDITRMISAPLRIVDSGPPGTFCKAAKTSSA